MSLPKQKPQNFSDLSTDEMISLLDFLKKILERTNKQRQYDNLSYLIDVNQVNKMIREDERLKQLKNKVEPIKIAYAAICKEYKICFRMLSEVKIKTPIDQSEDITVTSISIANGEVVDVTFDELGILGNYCFMNIDLDYISDVYEELKYLIEKRLWYNKETIKREKTHRIKCRKKILDK